MKVSVFKSLVFLFATVLTFTSCESLLGPKDIKSPGPSFDMDLFEANLEQALDGKVVGYSYSIGLNGQAAREGAGGSAILANTHPDYPAQVSMTPYQRMHIASISKPITAIALFKAIHKSGSGITLQTPIEDYLPGHWNLPNSVKTITFAQLLDHRSGLKAAGSSYDNLKTNLEAGVLPADKGQYFYNNANFGLMRILIAYILEPEVFSQTVMLGNDANIDQTTVRIFSAFMEKEVAGAAQVNHNIWTPNNASPVLFYDYSDLTKTAWLTPDYQDAAGGFGYFLSANSIASIFAHARHLNGYLPQPYYDWFWKDDMGWFSSNGEHGTYLVHNGAWFSNGRGYHGVVWAFPNNVEATVLVNCHNTPEADNIQNLVRDAYNDAWILP